MCGCVNFKDQLALVLHNFIYNLLQSLLKCTSLKSLNFISSKYFPPDVLLNFYVLNITSEITLFWRGRTTCHRRQTGNEGKGNGEPRSEANSGDFPPSVRGKAEQKVRPPNKVLVTNRVTLSVPNPFRETASAGRKWRAHYYEPSGAARKNDAALSRIWKGINHRR